MNNSEAYEEWIHLFDKNVYKIWRDESNEDLKCLSMLLFSINREIKKIQENLGNTVTNLKNSYGTQMKRKLLPRFEFISKCNDDKENARSADLHSNVLQVRNSSEIYSLNSPEIFQMDDLNSSPYTNSGSTITSPDNDPANTGILASSLSGSPEIKKKKRSKVFKRSDILSDTSTPDNSYLKVFKDNHAQSNCQDKDMTEVSSLDFLKVLARPAILEDGLRGLTNMSLKDNEVKASIAAEERKQVLTPLKSDNDLDLTTSMVQCTPVSNAYFSKRRDKVSYFSKKKNTNEKNSTITQMFLRNKCVQKRKKYSAKNLDSQETHVDYNLGNKSSIGSSAMGLSAMVSYINKDTALSDKEKEEDVIELDDDNSENIENNCDLHSDGTSHDDNGRCGTNLSKGLNNFLAKAQNIADNLAEPAPVVRGKARKKLPGWSCKDCEKFYLNQSMNPSEIMALNKCSRHRGYSKPREDTLPGFWDMNIVTQESKENDQ